MTRTCALRRSPLALAAIGAALAGCGPRMYPVTGTVTLADGAPLSKGMIVIESSGEKPVMARGTIGPDGRFQLSTARPGDGVPPGKYRVLINPMDLSDLPDEFKNIPFDFKYMKYETSGLECEVKDGPTEYSVQLDGPRRKGRR